MISADGWFADPAGMGVPAAARTLGATPDALRRAIAGGEARIGPGGVEVRGSYHGRGFIARRARVGRGIPWSVELMPAPLERVEQPLRELRARVASPQRRVKRPPLARRAKATALKVLARVRAVVSSRA
jgi:hypothetical protein